jgi:tRNA-binding protein
MTDRPDTPRATIEDFFKLDIRVGIIVEAEMLEDARKPAIKMKIDFGPRIGIRTSSAQITDAYLPEAIVGRFVLGVVNLPPRRVGKFTSEVLTLGVYSDGGDGPVVLISPDRHPSVTAGDRLG